MASQKPQKELSLGLILAIVLGTYVACVAFVRD
jgi:hypothetical protein